MAAILQEICLNFSFAALVSIVITMCSLIRWSFWLGVVLLQACGGGGGGSTTRNPDGSLAPLPVLSSSFENKAVSALVVSQVPKLSVLEIPGRGNLDSVPASLAVADFQRVGRQAAMVVASDGVSARVYVLDYDGSKWTDVSGKLFSREADRVSCALPQQSSVADFNGDGRPDVYVSCAGSPSIPKVPQYFYISRPDGTYAGFNTSTKILDAMGAAIADINGDTHLDVVSTDNGALVFMMGPFNNGQYASVDAQRLQSSEFAPLPSFVRSVFLVPRSTPGGGKRYDLVVGGDSATQGTPVVWYQNNGGYFNPRSASEARKYLTNTLSGNNHYDYVETANDGYLYVTTYEADRTHTLVGVWRFTRPSYESSLDTRTYSKLTEMGSLTGWPRQIRIEGNDLLPYDAGCGGSPVTANDPARCGKRFSLNSENYN